MAEIRNYEKSHTLVSGTSDNDSIFNYEGGTYVTINGGDGNDTIQNVPGRILLGTVNRGSSNVTINGDTGDDYIFNDAGNYVLIDGGSGNNKLSNSGGSKVTILGGSDNDYIKNRAEWYMVTPSCYRYVGGDSVTLNGGDGNDTISNDYGNNVSIIGGAGNDYVVNTASTITQRYVQYGLGRGGDNVTIEGGKGNDTIENNYGANVLFKYNSDDGNDKIIGFREDSTLSISGGSYSTSQSGDDIVVMVGSGSVTLKDAASLSKVNVDGKNILENSWTLSGTTAKYGTTDNTLVTVNGVKSTSGLSVSGNVVTVSKAALNTGKVTISDGYTLKLGSDVTQSTTKKATYNAKTMTYTTAGVKNGYSLASDSKSIN